HTEAEAFDFCPSCGAKVIRNRLTLKNLSVDIAERVFDIDNTFARTFLQLFSRPDQVIDNYIRGIRKRYMNPIGYFGIAITLSGILLLLMRRFFRDRIDFDVFGQGANPEVMNKVMNIMFDMNTLIFIIYVPIFAISGWLTFNRKSYNLTEYSVFYMYILAQWSIILFPISLATLFIFPENYLVLGIPLLIALVIYSIYAMQRLNRLSTSQLVLRIPIFSILVTIGYFGFIMVFYAVLFLTGILSLQDFAPVQ
ncbi:MAG: DUF3667 domain-containing protein, partial [Flavobacteriaceae bacterium]